MRQKRKGLKMSDNLKLWSAVEATPTKYVKHANVSGQMRTCVDAQHKKKMITKHLGVFGIGWGVKPESEKYERLTFPNNTMILQYTATAFFDYEGKRGEFPIAAAIKEAYMTKGGQGYLKVDDEAIKKVRTDAITKGFTDLGFCADIHMGMFDDNHYVQGLMAKEALEAEEEYEKKFNEEKQKLLDWLTKQVESAKTITNNESFVKALERVKQQVNTRCNAAQMNPMQYINRIDQIIGERLNANK